MSKITLLPFFVIAVCCFVFEPLSADTGQLATFRKQRVNPNSQQSAPLGTVTQSVTSSSPEQSVSEKSQINPPNGQQSAPSEKIVQSGTTALPEAHTSSGPSAPEKIQIVIPNNLQSVPTKTSAHSDIKLSVPEKTQVDILGTPCDIGALGELGSQGRSFVFEESRQQVVIAWNGKEELLVLSTRQASLLKTKTTVISFIPLPGKPLDISAGDSELFQKAFDKICRLADEEHPGWKSGRNFEGDFIFKKEIGSHHITVIEVINKDVDRFYKSIRQYLNEKLGADTETFISDTDKRVFEHYIKDRDFRYFVVDLQNSEANGVIKEKEAIAYHFESPYLFFPLYFSQVGGGNGETQVHVVAFTPNKSLEFFGIGRDNAALNYTPTVAVRPADLQEIDKKIAEIMSGAEKNAIFKGRVWVIDGQLNKFDEDLVVQ